MTRYERIIDRKPPLVDESIWHVQGFIPSPILRTNMRREIKGKKIHEGQKEDGIKFISCRRIKEDDRKWGR